MSRLATTGGLLGAALVGLLVLPILALAFSVTPADVMAGFKHELFAPALWLSLKTTLVSLAVTVICGTPLAWWLSRSNSPVARTLEILVEFPIILPPAVVGVALLQTFGRSGVLGPFFSSMGVSIPFTEVAVILAQIVVSAPFYIQAAANAFRKVEDDQLIVARTLGATPARAFWKVAVPISMPGLLVGASLAWARALGEFGATLLFAGNMVGETQTMPLAIYTALESDVRLAVVFSLVLTAFAAVLLVALRLSPEVFRRSR